MRSHNNIYFYLLHPFLAFGYQMKNHAWCSPYRNELFYTLSEAKKRCNEDSRCVMIYDDGGVEETFLLCDEGAKLSSSPSGSRLYIKDLFVDGGNIEIIFLGPCSLPTYVIVYHGNVVINFAI